MAINFLQQQAFILSPDFNTQMHGVVRQQAEYWWEFVPANDPQRDILRQQYAQVSEQPQNYGFVPTVVADAGWTITYDGWAIDPDAALTLQAIQTSVQKWWYLRTGIIPPTAAQIAAALAAREQAAKEQIAREQGEKQR